MLTARRPQFAIVSEGQEAHLALPFALDAALGKENQFVDSLSDRDDGPHLEDTWHWLTSGNSIERVLRQCRDVVGDDDALLVGGPFQNRRIICSREAHVLNTDDIELRVSAKEPSDDVAGSSAANRSIEGTFLSAPG